MPYLWGRKWIIENQRFKPCECQTNEERRKNAAEENKKRVIKAHGNY